MTLSGDSRTRRKAGFPGSAFPGPFNQDALQEMHIMEWLTYDKILAEPYNLKDFEILDNPHRLTPHERFTKQPLLLPDARHKYWDYSDKLDNSPLEEHGTLL